jgi:uncharacterized protein YoxC
VTAGDLLVVLAALLCALGFAALVVVLVRVLDTLRDLRYEVADLRAETVPLIEELRATTREARTTVDDARTDLERFDRVLGSAEAIGDAVSGRVARTAFSAPVIKATGFAKGTSRAFSRLRGAPVPSDRSRRAIEASPEIVLRPRRRRRRR